MGETMVISLYVIISLLHGTMKAWFKSSKIEKDLLDNKLGKISTSLVLRLFAQEKDCS